MIWIDAKCNDCGLQREVVLFVEPTNPRAPLRCPRCASLNVSDLHNDVERQRELDKALGIPDYIGVDVSGMTAGQARAAVDRVRGQREQYVAPGPYRVCDCCKIPRIDVEDIGPSKLCSGCLDSLRRRGET